MQIRPEVTCSMPATVRSSVVLPDPDGPSRTRNVPASTSSETPDRASWLPPGYRLVTGRGAAGDGDDADGRETSDHEELVTPEGVLHERQIALAVRTRNVELVA
jgi:hypothetical protein